MKRIRKNILLICCLVLAATYGNAQGNIKRQAEQKKQQQQYEQKQRETKLKEQARIKNAQLKLSDLLQLLQSKDVDYVDEYLSGRGWKMYSTNIQYDEGIPTNYKMIIWSFDKNPNDDLAKGWFYFYFYLDPTYANAIEYLLVDETHLNTLKSELTKSGYKRINSTDIIERGLESVYRNDLYEIIFKKQMKDEDEYEYEESTDFSYSFFIYSYKEMEKLKEEEERITRETAEQEAKYTDAIQRAENAYSQKRYAVAKQAYSEVLAVKPENREMLSGKITELDIEILCEEADKFFKTKQYEKAKEKYDSALTITPNKRIDFINKKIKEIEDFQMFLLERSYKKYDYETFHSSDYATKNDDIEKELRRNLLANAESLSKTTVNIVCEIDTLGVTVSNYTNSSGENKNLNAMLEKIIRDIKLERCFINDYSVSAKAEYNYTLEYNNAVVSVKKNSKNISSKDLNFNTFRSNIYSELNSAPFGKYTFKMNKTVVNGQEYNNNKLVKMKGIGGPANAWLSLLVPGLGDHRVTYGKRKGIGIAVSTYALVGAGVGLKLYSNSEYEKYHSATTQSEMDDHYKKANSYNQLFYLCAGAGAIVWLYDIIWVTVKGAKNKKEYNAWKRSHLSFYYEPNFQTTGLTYTIKF